MKVVLTRILKRVVKNKLSKNDGAIDKERASKIGLFTSISVALFTTLISFIVLICIIFMPAFIAEQYVSDAYSDVTLFFSKVGNLLTFNGWCSDKDGSCERKAEQKYYDELYAVYDKYKNNNVELDIDLLSGTIFYGNFIVTDSEDSDKMDVFSSQYDRVDLSDIALLAQNMVNDSSNVIDYEKYYNYLISEYISMRFSDKIESIDPDYSKEKIANEIMMFAQKEYVKGNGYGLNPIYKECSQVCPSDGSRCLDLEEFVVRVVDHESGPMDGLEGISEQGYIEEWKAQAVAARTATLFLTNSCTKPIVLGNNINILDPSSLRSNHDKIKEVIKDTAGQILTIDGKPITASWDSFYKGNNYHCDDSLCYSTYTKIGLTWEGDTHEIASYKKWEGKFLGGHGKGLSQYGAAYLADIGWNYKDILKYYYDDKTELSTLTSLSYGFMTGNKYKSNPPLYNNEKTFYSHVDYTYFATVAQAGQSASGFKYYGECPWFARGRAAEIVGHSDMPEDFKQKAINAIKNVRGNGADWYNILPSEFFSKSKDLYAAKPGAVVSWSGGKSDCPGGCGHVAIVEDVKYDANGRATDVLLSESWNGSGNPGNARYNMKWWNIEKFRSYNSNSKKTYYFNGYVYLLG